MNAVIRWIWSWLLVAAMVMWLPAPWDAVAGAVVAFLLGVTTVARRRLAERVRAVPVVRVTGARLLAVPPEENEREKGP